MKKFFVITAVSFSLTSALALAKDTKGDVCSAWADHMAKTTVPSMLYGAGGIGGFGLGMGYGTLDTSTESVDKNKLPGGGIGGIGIGTMGSGGMPGLGGFVLPLTEDVKGVLKDKAISSKYDQYVLASNSLMIEWGHASEKNLEAIKNGATPNDQPTPHFLDLNKKLEAASAAYRKELFAFGNKNGCMAEFDAAVQKRNWDQMAQMLKASSEQAKQMTDQLYKRTKKLQEVTQQLKDCKAGTKNAPNVSDKLDKVLNPVDHETMEMEPTSGLNAGSAADPKKE
ncbi:hypothetical protein WDW86_10990 [Bdellovibrionota bacterium FG-2]